MQEWLDAMQEGAEVPTDTVPYWCEVCESEYDVDEDRTTDCPAGHGKMEKL